MKPDLLQLAETHGTPLFIVDHEKLRENYQTFKKNLPQVQAYYAIKANSEPKIIKTFFDQGSSFDVASFQEFLLVYNLIKRWEEHRQGDYIWDKIIYSNTIKDKQALEQLKKYKPLVTYDNSAEIDKIKKHCDTAGLVLRVNVPDTGSIVEMGSKFGADPNEAMNLIEEAFNKGLKVEGLSFHVGSQCLNFDNYVKAFELTSKIFTQSRKKGYDLKLIDMGGGYPAPYDERVPEFEKLGKIITSECKRLFPKDTEFLAEPGRFMVATAATLVTQILGKSRRHGKTMYHINDGVYHTYSGVVFDHWIPNFHSFKNGETEICSVVGLTCDGFDKISLSEELPGNLETGDYLYTENIGAYSIASSTFFNGFPPAKVLHLNMKNKSKLKNN